VVHSSVDQYSRADDLLPNDKGYEKMGHDWFEAIQRVNKKGLIKDTPPGTADGPCVPPGDRFNSSLVLRITPLGASIVVGYGSTDKNGFREDLREKLTGNGAPVNVGI
jgi:lysophospholipase L1-like esterase